MAYTTRYRLRYLDRADPLNGTRQILADNAQTIETALTAVHARANDLIALLPAGQTVIALDTDGIPYFDPAGTVANPVPMGLDTDGTPYFLPTDPNGV
jgi:hypothetical protein